MTNGARPAARCQLEARAKARHKAPWLIVMALVLSACRVAVDTSVNADGSGGSVILHNP